MRYVLHGLDAERDAAAQETPAKSKPAVRIHLVITSLAGVDLFGSYPKNPSPAHTSQVNRPGVDSVRVITVCRQWGHNVCPGTSCREGGITTCVTAEQHKQLWLNVHIFYVNAYHNISIKVWKGIKNAHLLHSCIYESCDLCKV